MATPPTRKSPGEALGGLWAIGLTAFIVSALYFGRELLTPLALASFLTFLLAPLVTRLQRWLGRVGAVLAVVLLMVALTVSSAWILTRQIVDLGNQLPGYKENIRTKLKSFQLPSGGVFSKVSDTFDDLKKDLPIGGGEINERAAEGIQRLETSEDGKAIPVKVVSAPSASPMELFRLIVAPVVGPLGTSALVLLLLIFMLLKREDLRNRLIRLIGQGRISITTNAMDDAASRVSRYLRMLLIVNVTYGLGVTIGLSLIGVPNAILWGTFATVLRFIPYVGPWIAASFPVVLSLAVSSDWTIPLLTIGMFVVLELLSNNLMEPWLYGSSTGVSSFALIIAAVFWTYLWGPVGLVLATPITVCLAVLGRHIPRLEFLSILLSDEDPLTPAEECYHRLLRPGGEDELELAEHFLKSAPLDEFYDTVLIPALLAAAHDQARGALDRKHSVQFEAAVTELLDELDEELPEVAVRITETTVPPAEPPPILILPARTNRDHLAGQMLAQLHRNLNGKAVLIPSSLTTSEKAAAAKETGIACISVADSSKLSHARHFCAKVRAANPSAKILVGLWGASITPEAEKSLRESGADAVASSTREIVNAIRRFGAFTGKTPPHAIT